MEVEDAGSGGLDDGCWSFEGGGRVLCSEFRLCELGELMFAE